VIAFLSSFVVAMAAMSLVLAGTWTIQQCSGNSGWVDIPWHSARAMRPGLMTRPRNALAIL
jgi:steroid 5-alpha reductase family enzyme